MASGAGVSEVRNGDVGRNGSGLEGRNVGAQEGRTYSYGHHKVMALETGQDTVRVGFIDQRHPWPIFTTLRVSVARLVPLPMRYYHGEVPA